MEASTKATLTKTRGMAKERCDGMMVQFTSENG